MNTLSVCCDHRPDADQCYCFRCWPKRSETRRDILDPSWHQPGVYLFAENAHDFRLAWAWKRGRGRRPDRPLTQVYVGQTGHCVVLRALEHERDRGSPVRPVVSYRSAWAVLQVERSRRARLDLERRFVRGFLRDGWPVMNQRIPPSGGATALPWNGGPAFDAPDCGHLTGDRSPVTWAPGPTAPVTGRCPQR